MTPYARIKMSSIHLWIRFERVGRGSKFDLLLDTFRQAFPLADWDEHEKAWRLPVSFVEPVVHFCGKVFGSTGIKVQDYDTTEMGARQLSLL